MLLEALGQRSDLFLIELSPRLKRVIVDLVKRKLEHARLGVKSSTVATGLLAAAATWACPFNLRIISARVESSESSESPAKATLAFRAVESQRHSPWSTDRSTFARPKVSQESRQASSKSSIFTHDPVPPCIVLCKLVYRAILEHSPRRFCRG